MTHDLIPSVATAPDLDAGSGAAEAEEAAVSLPPGEVATAKPKASRRSTNAPGANTPRRKLATDSKKTPQPRGATRGDTSKAELVLKKLRQARGASVPQIMEATGWQAHSVRGFLSAVIRKKLGLDLTSEAGKDGVRRYRIAGNGPSGTA
jgi:hypothetical protein